MKIVKGRYWDEREKRFYYWSFPGEVFIPEGAETELFTGLLDKNGKEIYDGDILRETYPAYTWISRMERDHQMFVAKRIDPDIPKCPLQIEEDKVPAYEVIGNIYENPELLK